MFVGRSELCLDEKGLSRSREADLSSQWSPSHHKYVLWGKRCSGVNEDTKHRCLVLCSITRLFPSYV